MTLIYFCLEFKSNHKLIDLYSAAVAGGLLIGMKYFFLIFFFFTQTLILPELLKLKKRYLATYVSIIVILGGYWYFRNFFVLGNPVFPLTLFKKNIGVFWTGTNNASFLILAQEYLYKIYLLAIKDLSLGTYDGGMGMVFWGITFPIYIITLIKKIRSWKSQKEYLAFWILPIVGFFLLLLNPPKEMTWAVRWIIFIIPISFCAFAEYFSTNVFSKKFYQFLSLAIFFSALLSITLQSISVFPNYRLHSVLIDRANKIHPSEFRYFKDSGWLLPYMRYTVEPLDYLTKNDSSGFSCYLAADGASFWISNLYGTHFQNTISNFNKNLAEEPDAYIYQLFESPLPQFAGKIINPRKIFLNSNYSMVIYNDYSALLLKKSILENNGKKKLLKDYLEYTYAKDIEYARKFITTLQPDIPLLTVGREGQGFEYLKLTQELKNPFIWVHPQFTKDILANQSFEKIYSINIQLNGYTSTSVAIINVAGHDNHLWLNTH